MQTTRLESPPPEKALVVSIHDVSPWTESVVERMLDELQDAGVRRTSLLVVPNYHRRGWLPESERFCRWLREKVALGHEAVLHGCEHLRTPTPADSPLERLITEGYTAGEGEFHDLSFDEASVRLARGLRTFEEIGLYPRGFIAPAWLLGSEARRAVAASGFDYTVTLRQFIPLDGSAPTRSQSMVYSVRSAWRRSVSLGWNELLFRAMESAPLLRIAVHPVDTRHGRIREHMLKSIRRALVSREAIPYEGWLERLIRFR